MILKNELITQNYTFIEHEDNFKFGTPHHFEIKKSFTGETLTNIDFQEGPVKEQGVNGVHNEDLIAIVIERLKGFQDSKYKCRENDMAIMKLEECLMWLRKRTLSREDRGIEGTHLV